MRERGNGRWPNRRNADTAQEGFANQVATPLRAAQRTDPTFAARVMVAVKKEARGKGEGGRVLRTLSALAVAAGLVAIVLAAGHMLARRDRGAFNRRTVAVAHDTVHLVRFVLVAPGATSVAVVGDFNHWNREAHQLVSDDAGGVWSVSLTLPRGRHEYAFVIDGTRWTADPAAPAAVFDEFGGESSVITVGASAVPSSS